MLIVLELSSHARASGPGRNLATALFGQAGPSEPHVDLRVAYGIAREVARVGMRIGGARPPETPSYRLFWVHPPSGSYFAGQPLGPLQAFAVVGRHTHCDVVLPGDPYVALRHVLVRPVGLPSGVALRILDLQTQLGFVLPDGSRHTSIFADGPIAIAVGGYALVALPSERAGDELPPALPAPSIQRVDEAKRELAALAQGSPYRVSGRTSNGCSRITLMPRPVMVGEHISPTIARLVANGRWSLTLQRNQRSATITLTNEDLARGAIVGRSEKCVSEALRRVTDLGTSRAHLLLLRDGSDVTAYDLASTQGTFDRNGRKRRVVLSDGGTRLVLGEGPSAVLLTWRRIA